MGLTHRGQAAAIRPASKRFFLPARENLACQNLRFLLQADLETAKPSGSRSQSQNLGSHGELEDFISSELLTSKPQRSHNR